MQSQITVFALVAVVMTIPPFTESVNAASVISDSAVMISADNEGRLVVTLSAPLTFELTARPFSYTRVVFQDFFSEAPLPSGTGRGTYSGDISVLGTSAYTLGLVGSASASFGAIDENDLVFSLWGVGGATGQFVVVTDGTVVSDGPFAAFPKPTGSSTVSAFLTNVNGTIISKSITVNVIPEPNPTLLVGIGTLGFVARRRKLNGRTRRRS
jgi:hypothetical protein